MRQIIRKTLAVIGLVLMFAFPADAATDLGNGVCEDNGVLGVWNGTTADDDGCVTVAEYDVMFPGQLDTSLSVGPVVEPDAPTVREWFDVALDQRFGAR